MVNKVLFDIISIMSFYVVTKHDADVPLSIKKRKAFHCHKETTSFIIVFFSQQC